MHALSRRPRAPSSSGANPSSSPSTAGAVGFENSYAMVLAAAGSTTSSESSLLDAAAGGGSASELASLFAPESERSGPRRIPGGIVGEAFVDHDRRTRDLGLTGGMDWSLDFFSQRWEANRERYERVAARTGVPAVLVAALHFRESSMDFGTYLHQGDPLGRPAVNWPNDIPVFSDWEEAAIHALNSKKNIRDDVGMDENTDDLASMATYSEAYNGFGYRYKGKSSAYVYAGTNQYEGGRYVRDGVFDPNSWDQRPGTMALITHVDGGGVSSEPLRSQTPDEAWEAVRAGSTTLRAGQRSLSVECLQEKLNAAGYRVGVDGDFGPATRAAVIALQRANGLLPDGVVGPATASLLQGEVATEVAEEEEPDRALDTSPVWASIRGGNLLVRRGDVGESARLVQEALVAAGYAVSVDGDFGPRTEAAVRRFQADHGLPVDGLVGARTVAAF